MLTYENDFAEFIKVKDRGGIAEIDGEMFDYWLGVLPPSRANKEQNGESMLMTDCYSGQWVRRDGSLQRFSFAFAEGTEYLTVFWQKDDRFYAQRTSIINPR